MWYVKIGRTTGYYTSDQSEPLTRYARASLPPPQTKQSKPGGAEKDGARPFSNARLGEKAIIPRQRRHTNCPTIDEADGKRKGQHTDAEINEVPHEQKKEEWTASFRAALGIADFVSIYCTTAWI